jgi:predicted AAA+ superfamily ATPase
VDYLKQEVFDEGQTRNVAAFSRFFDAVGFSHGELTNYANIARDCGVDAKTVKEYYQILVDSRSSLRAFVDDNRPRRAVVVCNERAPRVHEGIELLPWRDFLASLWGGGIVR